MSSRDKQLRALMAERILVLDGAMGTLLQAHNLDEAGYRGQLFSDHGIDLKGDHDVLCLTHPELVRDAHLQYLAAGVDIITTNTFTATSVSQANYGLEGHAYEKLRDSHDYTEGSHAFFEKRKPVYKGE